MGLQSDESFCGCDTEKHLYTVFRSIFFLQCKFWKNVFLVQIHLKYTFRLCVCLFQYVDREKKQQCLCSRCGFLFLLPDRTGVKTEIQSGLLLLLVSQFLHVLVVLVVGLQQLVPPGEGGGVVPDEVHVVEVVEAGAGVERDQVERVPGDVVTTEREQGKKSSLSTLFLRVSIYN